MLGWEDWQCVLSLLWRVIVSAMMWCGVEWCGVVWWVSLTQSYPVVTRVCCL